MIIAIVVLLKPLSAEGTSGGCHQPSNSHKLIGASEGCDGSLARLNMTYLRGGKHETDIKDLNQARLITKRVKRGAQGTANCRQIIERDLKRGCCGNRKL